MIAGLNESGRQAGRPGPATGAALLLCLLLLTALTMLGLAAASDAYLQDRMAGNLEHAGRSKRIAESSLSWAEDWLFSLDGSQRPVACSDNCRTADVIRMTGVYPPAPEYANVQWWRDNAFAAGHDPVSDELLAVAFPGDSGFWIIEEVRFESAPEPDRERPDIAYYRIISRGADRRDRNVIVTESIVARPWGDPGWSDALPQMPGHTSLCRRHDIAGPCGRLAWRQRR